MKSLLFPLALAVALPASALESEDLCKSITTTKLEKQCLALTSNDRGGCSTAPVKADCERMIRFVRSKASTASSCMRGSLSVTEPSQDLCSAIRMRRSLLCNEIDDSTHKADCKKAVAAFIALDKEAKAPVSEDPVVGEEGFRRNFSRMSMGTEQELTGINAKISPKYYGKLGEVTWKGENVLDVTTDMTAGSAPPKTIYTIELISHPAEVESEDEWDARKNAFDWVIGLLDGDDFRNQNGPDDLVLKLKTGVAGDLELVGDKVTGSAKQATVGVPSSEIGRGTTAGKLIESAPWFDGSLADDLEDSAYEDPDEAQRVFAFVASTHAQLTAATRKYGLFGQVGTTSSGGTLGDPAVKNSWGILPRTPPIKMLDHLSTDDKAAVLEELRGLGKDAVTRITLDWILRGKSLNSHSTIDDATVGDEAAMLFEFRSESDIPKDLAVNLGLTTSEKEAEEARLLMIESRRRGGPMGGGLLAGIGDPCKSPTITLWTVEQTGIKLKPKGLELAERVGGTWARVTLCGEQRDLSEDGLAEWRTYNE